MQGAGHGPNPGGDEPDQPTQELPESVVDDIRRSSEAELAEFGYSGNDSQTLDIIDNVLNQVREAVRSTGFERPAHIDSTNFQFEADLDEPEDRMELGTDHPAPATGALERTTPAYGHARGPAAGGGGAPPGAAGDQTMLDLRFVTELARKHGIAEAKYEVLARRLREAERSHGFERVELSDHLYGVYLDLQTAAAQFGSDEEQTISGMRRALGRVEALYQRLAEHSRAFREAQGLPESPPTGAWSSASRQAISETGVDPDALQTEAIGDERAAGESSRSLDPGSGSRSTFITPWSEPHGRISGEWSSGRRRLRRRWPPRRIARWAAGIGVPVLLLWWFVAASARPVSREAVIDAPTVAREAPIAGEVQPTTLSAGDRVEAGETLVVITNDQVDTTDLEVDLARDELLATRLADHEAEYARLEAQREELLAERDRWRESLLARLEQQLAEQEALLIQTESALVDQQDVLRRLREAEAANQAAAREADADQAGDAETTAANSEDAATGDGDGRARPLSAESPRVQSQLRIIASLELKRDAQRALRDRIQERYRAAAEGIYQAGDEPPQNVRIAEIDQRLVGLRDRIDDQRDRREQLAVTIAQHRARIEALRRAEVVASVDGVVWQRNARGGVVVAAGDPLISLADPHAARIVAWLDADAIAEVATDMPAYIKLHGDGRVLRGRVRAVGDVVVAPDTLADVVARPPPGSIPVTITIDDPRRLDQVLGSRSVTVLINPDEDSGTFARLSLKFRMWLEF